MSLKLKLSDLAIMDLVGIEDYTARIWGDDQADKYLDKLEQRFYWLAEHEHIGKSRENISPRLYSFPEGRHVIFYRFNETMLEVARILHCSMDVEHQFE